MTTFDEPPAQPPPPRPRRRGRRLLLTLLVLALLGAGVAGSYAAWALGGTGTGQTVRVIVPEGATGAEIAALLERHDVVRSGFVFRIVARMRGVATNLKPGAYEMRTGLGVDAAIGALERGVPLKVTRLTIPEGLTVKEIARVVGRRTKISERAFLREAQSGRHRISIMPKGVASLEGLLFPKTYEIVEKTTAAELVQILLRQFERETAPLNIESAERHGLTPYEVVILASLIEKEARLAREQPLVSSVIHNRLRRGMRLDIDATIQYVYIQQTGRPKNPLLISDYQLESRYNTYKIAGLPPTPIAAPGLSAIRAALRPAKTSYYFYRLCDPNMLARGHVFSETLSGRDREWQRRCR